MKAIPGRSVVRGVAMAAVAAGGLGGAGLLAYNSLFNVEGGHRAVVYNRFVGLREEVYKEGTHFMLPWVERPTVYDVRQRPRVINSLTGSRDLQMVNVALRVLSRPDSGNLPEIHRTLGPAYDEKVLPSIVNEVLKSVVAQFNAAELLTMRERVSRKVREALIERAADFNIMVEDVSITDLRFGSDFMSAVEAKQVAQQEAERARYIVQKALQDKKSTIIRAQGEARSASMIGRAIRSNPAFVELRRLEAAREIATVLSRSHNRVYLNADSLLLNLLADDNIASRLGTTTSTPEASRE